MNNNLLPTPEQAIKAKDLNKAFLRFDDKPMITGSEAVSRSLLRYCMNGEYCIAAGDGTNFTRYYLKESVPFFDVTESSYWLVDKSLKPAPKLEPLPNPEVPGQPEGKKDEAQEPGTPQKLDSDQEQNTVKKFKSITVSGKVPLERYTELFNYFITPFAMSSNKIDIEVSFKINSNTSSPIDESKQQYKCAKEASRQLGLNIDEEA